MVEQIVNKTNDSLENVGPSQGVMKIQFGQNIKKHIEIFWGAW